MSRVLMTRRDVTHLCAGVNRVRSDTSVHFDVQLMTFATYVTNLFIITDYNT